VDTAVPEMLSRTTDYVTVRETQSAEGEMGGVVVMDVAAISWVLHIPSPGLKDPPDPPAL